MSETAPPPPPRRNRASAPAPPPAEDNKHAPAGGGAGAFSPYHETQPALSRPEHALSDRAEQRTVSGNPLSERALSPRAAPYHETQPALSRHNVPPYHEAQPAPPPAGANKNAPPYHETLPPPSVLPQTEPEHALSEHALSPGPVGTPLSERALSPRAAPYHETQPALSRLCLVPCLNMLLGEQRFTKQDLDLLCEELQALENTATGATPVVFNQHRSVFGGNYDVDVMLTAAKSVGVEVDWFDSRLGVEGLLEVMGSSYTRSPGRRFVGLVLNHKSAQWWSRFLGGRHWVVVRRHPISLEGETEEDSELAGGPEIQLNKRASRWYLLDSLAGGPEELVFLSPPKAEGEAPASADVGASAGEGLRSFLAEKLNAGAQIFLCWRPIHTQGFRH